MTKPVETPKQKTVAIPDVAKAEIAHMTQTLDTYLAGIAAGLDIPVGKWSFSVKDMKFIIKE